MSGQLAALPKLICLVVHGARLKSRLWEGQDKNANNNKSSNINQQHAVNEESYKWIPLMHQ